VTSVPVSFGCPGESGSSEGCSSGPSPTPRGSATGWLPTRGPLGGHELYTCDRYCAVTLSYLTAFALSFVLNRAFNFPSHGALGQQTTKYVVALGINYAAFVLGVGDGLTAIGVEYQLARILSGLCEGVYMYSVMRWVVFRDARAAYAPGGRHRFGNISGTFLAPDPTRTVSSGSCPVQPFRWPDLRRKLSVSDR